MNCEKNAYRLFFSHFSQLFYLKIITFATIAISMKLDNN